MSDNLVQGANMDVLRLAVGPQTSQGQVAGGGAATATKAPAVPITITDDLRRKFAATVLAEAYDDEEQSIAWIYYNRVMASGEGEAALNASNAFRKKSGWWKVWMVALGDSTYAKEKSEVKGVRDFPTIAEYVKGHGWFQKVGQPRADACKDILDRMHRNPAVNPYKGWEGQGSFDDFNLDSGKWKKARQYWWLQQSGDVKGHYVKLLLRSVVFDERAIDEFFKRNPGMLPKKVKKYQP